MVGDGSYLMLNSELYSSVLSGHKMILIVCDNEGFAVIERLQLNKGGASYNNMLADSLGTGSKARVDFRAHAEALGATAFEVNSLADRLTPRRMVDEALTVVKARGTDLARDAGNVVKAHPVATGAAVAAIGLALYAGNRISKAEIDLGHDLDDYSDYEDSARTAAAAATEPAVPVV